MQGRDAEPVTSDLTTPEQCNRNFRDYQSPVPVAIMITTMDSLRRMVQPTAKTAIIQRPGRLQGSIIIKQLSGLTGNMLMFHVRNVINRKMKVQ
jgi:hypothetical protein